MRLFLLLGICLSLLASSAGASAKPKKSKVEAEVTEVLEVFRAPEGISMVIKKVTKNTVMMTEKTSKGVLYYWRGKLRLEIQAPEESLLVLDGRNLWLANQLPKDLGGKLIVTKTSAGNLKKSNAFIAALLENHKLFSRFNLKNRIEDKGDTRLEFKTKDPDKSEIQSLGITYLTKEHRLARVEYRDDRENEVSFEFGTPQPVNGDRKKLFSYLPPKGAVVTEF